MRSTYLWLAFGALTSLAVRAAPALAIAAVFFGLLYLLGVL